MLRQAEVGLSSSALYTTVEIRPFRSLTSVKVLREFPAHLFVQVVEALSTYPTVVLGDVPFPLDVRGIGLREFCPASFAVIVVPILPWRDVLLRAEDCAPSPLCFVDAPVRHGESKPIMSIVVSRRLHSLTR